VTPPDTREEDDEGKRKGRLRRLQARLIGIPISLPPTPEELRGQIIRVLRKASDTGRLTDSPKHILDQVVLIRSPCGTMAVITGGEKNFDRDPRLAHFTRADGAWFDFALTVRHPRGEQPVLFGYNFEIRFPADVAPAFYRTDLNLPGHSNEAETLRCHAHPGNDDLSVPAPVMTPIEILEYFIYELRVPDKPRTPAR
jgi:hypothetical protein